MIFKENEISHTTKYLTLFVVLLPFLVLAYLTVDSHELLSAIHSAITTLIILALGLREIEKILSK